MNFDKGQDLFDHEALLGDINYVMRVHEACPRTPRKAYRQWDGRTPYSIHPIWCAATLLSETKLSEDIRERGAVALLYHDVPEDTTAPLPKDLSHEVRALIKEMTFFGGFAEEAEEVWKRSPLCRLLKLYDKVHNLLDGRDTWMPEKEDKEYRRKYEGHTLRLCADVEKNFGRLNITLLARTILNHG